jgi:hypothetical protein
MIAGVGVAAFTLTPFLGGCASMMPMHAPSGEDCAVIRAVLEYAPAEPPAWRPDVKVYVRLASSDFRDRPELETGRQAGRNLDVRRCPGLAVAPSRFQWTANSTRQPLRIGLPVVSGDEAAVSFGSRYVGHDYRLRRVEGEWRVEWRSETEVWI